MTTKGAAPDIAEILLARFWQAAEEVFYLGATPWEVDAALEGMGFAQGPFLAQDLYGLDRVGRLYARVGQTPLPPLLPRMLELGKYGPTTGAGWYRYPGGGGAVEDPIVADLALEEAHFAGRRRDDYGPEEICRRVGLALILAALSLPQGTDVDTVARQVVGYPPHLGGPRAQGARLGAAHLRHEQAVLAHEVPSLWTRPQV